MIDFYKFDRFAHSAEPIWKLSIQVYSIQVYSIQVYWYTSIQETLCSKWIRDGSKMGPKRVPNGSQEGPEGALVLWGGPREGPRGGVPWGTIPNSGPGPKTQALFSLKTQALVNSGKLRPWTRRRLRPCIDVQNSGPHSVSKLRPSPRTSPLGIRVAPPLGRTSRD